MANRKEEYIKLYNKENRQMILDKKHQYYENNKESLSIKSKIWYENNKEKVLEYHKRYAEENWEKKKLRRKTYSSRTVCCKVCNKEIRIDGYSKHLKTKVHLKNEEEMESSKMEAI